MKIGRNARRVGGAVVAAGLILALPVAVGGSEPLWRPLAETPAPARQEVSYVALDGRLYLAGGDSREQDRYDPASDAWTPTASLPPAFEGVDHVHGVAIGGRIVYIGGLLEWEQPFPVIGEVAVYDPASDSFASAEQMPSPRAAGGVAAWRGRAIYAGGLGPDGSVARVDAYDPVADEWLALPAMPRPRDHFQAVVVGDDLYVVGGRETDGDGGTEEIAAVDVLELPADPADLPSASWRAGVASLPTPRGGLGVAALGDCVYAIGGEGAFGVTGATEAYDTASGQWHALPPLGTPRHGIQAAVVGATVFVAGGGKTAFDQDPTLAHEALDVSDHAPCAAEELGGGGGSSPTAPGAASPLLAGMDGGRVASIERLAVRPNRPRLGAGQGGRAGIRFVVVLSGPADVLLVVQRAVAGRLAAGRCLARPRPRSPGERSCTTWLPRWRRVHSLPAGRSVVPFDARGRGGPLPPGRYRLLAGVRDSGGEPSRSQASFRITG